MVSGQLLTLWRFHTGSVFESAVIFTTLEGSLLHRDRLCPSIIPWRKGLAAHRSLSGTAVALGSILNDTILKPRAPSVGTHSYDLGLGDNSQSRTLISLALKIMVWRKEHR